jgi:hypothetical protein
MLPLWEERLGWFLLGPPGYVDRHKMVRAWLLALGVGGGLYGAAMGSYGGLSGERFVQLLYSAVKVPLLLIVTTLLAAPSFFVLNTLLGLRSDFGTAFRAVLSTQGTIAIVLASLAPFTLLWYASFTSYYEASLFNAGMFLIASAAAQWVLRRRYAELEGRNSRHRMMRRLWIGLYAFVGIQMGWILRPFIGDPGMRPTFFRTDTFENAYVILFEKFTQALLAARC